MFSNDDAGIATLCDGIRVAAAGLLMILKS
jgi:hypothetical protein